MDYWSYKEAAIDSVRKSARLFLATKEINHEFYDAVQRWVESENTYMIAALLLNDAPKGDIITALENFMFSEKYIEHECARIESWKAEDSADRQRYDELGY